MKAGIFILFAISISIFTEQGNTSPIQDVEDGGQGEYHEGNKNSMITKYNSPKRRATRSIFRWLLMSKNLSLVIMIDVFA